MLAVTIIAEQDGNIQIMGDPVAALALCNKVQLILSQEIIQALQRRETSEPQQSYGAIKEDKPAETPKVPTEGEGNNAEGGA